MGLISELAAAKSEEDVKDAYIKALGLKSKTKGLIDIQTKEIWFEAKHTGKESSYAMFTQLLHYVQDALNKGETVPPFLCVIDTVKAAIMKTSDVIPFLQKKTIKWGKSASQYTPEALSEVSNFIGTYFVQFKIATHEEEFIETVKKAIASGDIIRTQITPDNLKQVFDKWVNMIGKEVMGVSEDDYVLLFFADIMHDGKSATHDHLPAKLLHDGEKPVFLLNGQTYELWSHEGYRQFWAIYHKPPKAEYRNYLLERRDSLIPLDERSFKGAYYTPLAVVDKAYDLLEDTLGKNWQKNYIVWDMCCGVGNLEVKHSNPRNVFMSTLDQADVDVMKASKTCVAAERFQYDYLNDDVTDDGCIDYGLTDKLPKGLRQAIADFNAGKAGAKRILVLMNPPYAEAASASSASHASRAAGCAGDRKGDRENTVTKTGVSRTKVSSTMMADYGWASRELFTQFLARLSREIPNATLAMFSTLKYVNAPNFEGFRAQWRAEYLAGFAVHSRAFDGVKGDFPIGFLVWKTGHGAGAQGKRMGMAEVIGKGIAQGTVGVTVEVLDRDVKAVGEKRFFGVTGEGLLGNWIRRPRVNGEAVVPLKNAITVATATRDLRGTRWSDGAVGCMFCQGSDVQHVSQTALLSSGFGSAGAFFVNGDNLWQAAVVFAVRRLVKRTWLNDRDQFLAPGQVLPEEFKDDCLVWMLFNGSNLSASADGLEWNGQRWSIVNHFIPFTEAEVGAPGRFESDFMVRHLEGKVFSPEAQEVLDEGKRLWRVYFGQADEYGVREALKLNRPDVGWYQVRKALEARNAAGSGVAVDFSGFKLAYDKLGDKLRPMVYGLGFLG